MERFAILWLLFNTTIGQCILGIFLVLALIAWFGWWTIPIVILYIAGLYLQNIWEKKKREKREEEERLQELRSKEQGTGERLTERKMEEGRWMTYDGRVEEG